MNTRPAPENLSTDPAAPSGVAAPPSDEDSHLPCWHCGNDITRERQAAGEMRYLAGDICAYAHARCAESRKGESR